MSAERLFQILGLIDEDLIEEAAQPQRQKRPRRGCLRGGSAAGRRAFVASAGLYGKRRRRRRGWGPG